MIDGRRPMVSGNDLTVDLNTIPQALIERIEVITGGAGAAYGADAVSGAVNIILKKKFEGIDIRAGYSNSSEKGDDEEYNISIVTGGNFADGKGSAIFAFDRSYREAMYKNQRPFSIYATSTTGTPPQGVLRWASSNAVTQAAVDNLFAKYGVKAGDARAMSGRIGFNRDGSLFFGGVFNSPLDVQNFKDPIDISVNKRFYPDFYSYNFDPPNILQLPLDRYSFVNKMNYRFDNGIEVFTQAGYTRYEAATGLAPTPVPSVKSAAPGTASSLQVSNPLVTPGKLVSGSLVVPVTNPFIPADLAALLASRTGDDPNLVGSGASEAFQIGFRPTAFGLRKGNYTNTVIQYLGGARGPIPGISGWDFEAYISEGRTTIQNSQTGNIDTQKLSDMLIAADGGASKCKGGYNPFGVQPISAECINYLSVALTQQQDYLQQIGQAYVRGKLFDLPAGTVSGVFGAEYRGFSYHARYLSTPGPFSGFNVSTPDKGTNAFRDVFAEFLVPLVKDQPFARTLDLNLGYRHSTAEFTDKINNISSTGRESDSYKAELSWEPLNYLRFRGSYQRSVREPNFAELFASSTSFPQIFDPCSFYTGARNGANKDKVKALCIATGVAASTIDNFAATPGAQAQIQVQGNLKLNPEKADTVTLGAIFKSPWENKWLSRLRGTLDWYSIKIDGPIITPNTNIAIAECFNYYGGNPNYDPNNRYCKGFSRNGDITGINYVDEKGNVGDSFPGINGGTIETSGIDLQLDWGFDAEWLNLSPKWGKVSTNLLLTYVDSVKQSDAPGLKALEYAGTVSYFGAGLGTSYPKVKANWNVNWNVGDFTINSRTRFIEGMKNRASIQFPGEVFTGTKDVYYWDLAGSWKMNDHFEFRLGVNNVFDKQPQVYAPNVQSGTDPSTYDIVGRRIFGQITVRY